MGSHTGADESKLGDADCPHGGQGGRDARPLERDAVAEETPLRPAAELEKKYADATKNAAVEDELEK